jgi:hypothetical protein
MSTRLLVLCCLIPFTCLDCHDDSMCAGTADVENIHIPCCLPKTLKTDLETRP